jgi:hypothetical protein
MAWEGLRQRVRRTFLAPNLEFWDMRLVQKWNSSRRCNINGNSIPAYKKMLSDYDCVRCEIADCSLNELDFVRSFLYGALKCKCAATGHLIDHKTNKISIGFVNVEKNKTDISSSIISLTVEDEAFRSILSKKSSFESFKLEDMFVLYEGEIASLEAE